MIQHLVFIAAAALAASFAQPEGALAEKSSSPSSAATTSPEGFPDVERMFGSGQYEKASRLLNRLILDSENMTNPKKARLYLLKARIELAYERSSEIELWLRKAFRADPDLSLDPVKDPPKLLALWEELQKEHADSTGKPDGRNRKPQKSRPSAAAPSQPDTEGPPHPHPDKPETTAPGGFVAGESSPLRLLPFGVGHFAAGDLHGGAFFLVAEASVLAVAERLPAQPALIVPKAKVTTDALFGALGLWGLYGYELADVFSPESPLPLFPFGVNQAIRGETQKALAFATAETLFLMAGTLSPDASTRRMGLGLFAATWALELVDGVAGQTVAAEKKEQTSVALLPTWNNKGKPGARVNFEVAF